MWLCAQRPVTLVATVLVSPRLELLVVSQTKEHVPFMYSQFVGFIVTRWGRHTAPTEDCQGSVSWEQQWA